MHRNPDGPRLVGYRAGDRLADPPGGIGRELETATVVELVYRPHQTDVPFLDQVKERQTAVYVLLGYRNDQAEVRFRQFLPRLISFERAAAKRLLDSLLRLSVLNGCPLHHIDQLTADGGRRFQLTNRLGQGDARPPDLPLLVNVGPLATPANRGGMGLALRLQFLPLLAALLRALLNPFDRLECGGHFLRARQQLACPVLYRPIGQLRVRQYDGLTERARPVQHLLRDRGDVARHEHAARHCAGDTDFAPLDPLCDRHFTLAGKQWHPAHLAKISADEILSLIFFVRDRLRRSGLGGPRHGGPLGIAIVYVDPFFLEILHDGGQILILQVGRRMLQHLIERDVSSVLPEGYEILDDFLAFLYQQAVNSPVVLQRGRDGLTCLTARFRADSRALYS